MSDWLEKMGVSILKNQESSAAILEKFVETARPASVFASPLSAGDYTIITASEVYAGMGVGFGGGGGSGPAGQRARKNRSAISPRRNNPLATTMKTSRPAAVSATAAAAAA